MAAEVKCPKCKRLVEYSKDNPYRPFCSERCKMVDLGQWANEEYAIPSHKPVNEEELSRALGELNSDDKPTRGDLH